MKINKILAAGIAATLAVTSLSAVASAEVQTKTFDVYRTTAEFWSHSIKFNADVNKTIAQKLRQATTGKIAITQIEKFLRDDLAYEGFIEYLISEGETTKALEYAADKTKLYNGSDLMIGGISITATGYQHIGDTATVTKTFKFQREPDAADATAAQKGYSCREWWGHNGANKPWILTVLDDKTPVYHDGEFASYFFTEITSLQLEVQINGVTADEEEYNYWTSIGTRDALKRWMDIGDIAVYEKSADTEPLYTYGNYAHNYDYDEIIGAQAKESVAAWTAPANADGMNAAAKGTGILLGSPSDSASYPVSVTSTQTLYEGTGEKAAALAAANGEKLKKENATAYKAEKVDYTETPVVNKDGDIITSGTVIKISTGTVAGKEVIYLVSSKTLTDKQIEKISDAVKAPLVDATAAADVEAANAEAAAKAAKLNNDDENPIDKDIKVYGAAAADLPIYKLVDKDAYENLALDAKSGGAGAVKLDAKKAVLKSVDGAGNATYKTNPSPVYAQAFSSMVLSDAVSTAHLLAYAFANGGWYESKSIYGDNDNATANDSGLVGTLNPATKKTNGWLPKTTNGGRKQVKNLIERTDALLLSKTGEHTSDGVGYGSYGSDANQSYNATFWEGTNPYGFAGLASQVADFFNKQDNGTITFTFAADAGNTAGKWNDGVPSTEVGLKGFSSEYLNDFALFFNYSNTTGTMLSAIKADPTSGTATFDISDYLKDCGGLTKATLENIYYGLDNGIRQAADSNLYGFWVSKVELAYDDAGKAAVDATTDDDTSDDAAVVVADDDDDAEVEDDDVAEDDDIFEDDDVIEDDDDDDDDVDADVIEDDDDDDTDVNNDVDYVDAGADDDANPGTGVGLAVIPAIVAAAAVVVSKKRK